MAVAGILSSNLKLTIEEMIEPARGEELYSHHGWSSEQTDRLHIIYLVGCVPSHQR